jgi:hypothetical protein
MLCLKKNHLLNKRKLILIQLIIVIIAMMMMKMNMTLKRIIYLGLMKIE